MLADAPNPGPTRHAYVEGPNRRTAKDGRVYKLCAVCNDRSNAFPHRGFRTTPLTLRERADHHPFDPSLTVFLTDSRGHRMPACLQCGKGKRATEHGGLTRFVGTVTDADYSAPEKNQADPVALRPRSLRALPAVKPEPPVRVAKSVERMPSELVQAALAIDRLLALPDDLVDWRLRMRLTDTRKLIGIPVFPTLDVRLTPDVVAEDEVPPDDNLAVARTATALPAATGVVVRSVLAGIRNDRIRELVKRAAADGWTVGKTGSGHVSIAKGSQRMILSTTSNDGRMGHGWGNVRAAAKRAGLDVTGL